MLVGMKDFVKIQYSVLWKLCFDQTYFWLAETITGIRGKKFSKKEVILTLRKLVYRLVETIFSSIFWRLLPVFLRLVVSIFQGNPYFRLVEKYFRVNNGFHKQKKRCKQKNTVFDRKKFWLHQPDWRIR